ncbi:hypothetical protein EIP86_002204 [Pleurotus ostreatoroseus]|nr:hypothetical protein EIP86_002204 [Pleurotus ostreatoroseus]
MNVEHGLQVDKDYALSVDDDITDPSEVDADMNTNNLCFGSEGGRRAHARNGLGVSILPAGSLVHLCVDTAGPEDPVQLGPKLSPSARRVGVCTIAN